MRLARLFSWRYIQMASLEEKSARLKAAKQKVDEFVAGGGDLGSKAAVPVGIEFVEAFADVAKEFGYEILKPTKKPDFPA
jgi:hypothetical protein